MKGNIRIIVTHDVKGKKLKSEEALNFQVEESEGSKNGLVRVVDDGTRYTLFQLRRRNAVRNFVQELVDAQG